MRIALVFPGQGSQKVGMGKAPAEAAGARRAVALPVSGAADDSREGLVRQVSAPVRWLEATVQALAEAR